ncbi:hypothetical protein, partial [Vibrio variabilis]|uniref:hypothetical protein n=1 Tax=Vibrio variabilis TaxID=990271 RepID=UPI001EFA252B
GVSDVPLTITDGSITLPAGVTEFKVTVATTQDDVFEGPETFGVTVTDNNNVTTNAPPRAWAPFSMTAVAQTQIQTMTALSFLSRQRCQ